MIPDPLTFAHRWQRCGCAESPEAERGPNPQCVALAALIEARGREIRADECDQIAAMVRARTTADNANVGPNGRVLERRAITRALRHRAARHRGDTND